jgi:molybdate transport system ATP-binding protein
MSLIVEIKKRLGSFYLDVSLETSGGISGLLGASGSGKSMTLMCIAGIVKPDSGKIILNGVTLFNSERHINLVPQQRRTGYLFQNYALFPNMTVRQNILCGLHNEKTKAKREYMLNEMIDLMQLRGLEKLKPSQLSGGQQQRVALARILAGNPSLLMLDEPFSALDSHLREQVQAETQRLLLEYGKESFLVTHSRDEAFEICDSIALIDSGKLIAYKETKRLFASPESRQAALLTGCKNVVDAKKTGEYSVYVPAWNVQFTTSEPVHDDLRAIGIRAHHFDPKAAQNRRPVRIIDETESPFEYRIQFRYENQHEESQNIWRLTPKGKETEHSSPELGVAGDDIMLLYK